MDHSFTTFAHPNDPWDLEKAFAQELARQCGHPEGADASHIEALVVPILALDQGRKESTLNDLLCTAVRQLYNVRFPREWHIRLIQFALDHGADPNAQWHSSRDGALMCPVKKIVSGRSSIQSLQALDLLLERGALHTWNDEESAALDIAVSSNRVDFAGILISHGADMYRRGLDGSRPVDHVVKNNNIEMLRVFIDQGVDVNFTGQDDLSLLQRAMFSVGIPPEQKKEFLECLLKAGADPNRGENGMAWSGALAPKNLNLLPLFVEYGAKLDPEENQKMRPIFHTLVYYNKAHTVTADHDEIIYAIDALLEMGADPEDRGHCHQTAYQSAEIDGRPDLARLIRTAVTRREAAFIQSQTQEVIASTKRVKL